MRHYLNTSGLLLFIQSAIICFTACSSDNADLGSSEFNDTIPAILSIFSEFDLIKCKCGGEEILENGTDCLSVEGNSIDYMSFSPYETFSVDVQLLRSVIQNNQSFEETCSSMGKRSIQFDHFYFAKHFETSKIQLFHPQSGRWFDSYCVEHFGKNTSESLLTASVCIPAETINVPTCCLPGYIIGQNNNCIMKEKATFEPPIYMGRNLVEHAEIIPVLIEKPKCILATLFLSEKSIGNATLHYNDHNVVLETMDSVAGSSFCVGIEEISGEYTYKVLEWGQNSSHVCVDIASTTQWSDEGKCEDIMYWVGLPLLILSSVLLIIILVLCALLIEMRKSLGSKMIMCHILSLLAGFITMIALHVPQDANCKAYGPVMQICFLSCFFWLNIMCFDMWLKLRCIRPSGQSEASAKNRFLVYSIYAWGCPLGITIASVVIDNVIDPTDPQGWIVPGWGVKNCWYMDSSAAMLYYFGPIAVLMVFNLFCFVWVFATLVKANIVSGRILKTRTTPSHRRVWIYLKIFFMMGVSWIFEYISWQEGTCEYWIVTDIINTLRGVILFLIMFGSKQTLKKTGEKLNIVNRRINARLTSSVNNLRKLSLVSNLSQTVETRIESRRPSEIVISELNIRSNQNKIKKDKTSSENTNKMSSVL